MGSYGNVLIGTAGRSGRERTRRAMQTVTIQFRCLIISITVRSTMMAYRVFSEDLSRFGKCTVGGRKEETAFQSRYKYLICSKTTQIMIK